MFSIVIPSFNNLNYLKILINSIKKNSNFGHEIIIHINEGSDGTLDYVKNLNLKYTHTKNNVGLCSATNIAAKRATTDYILYSHDDMYFCPNWDVILKKEIDKLNTKAFYLSGTMIEKNSGHIQIDCGDDYTNFNEKKFLENYSKIEYFDHQGTHWAPHLIHNEYWKKIGGFSEEFNPGIGSDPDLNMKLWKCGVRIFKGLSDFRVYHFGSVVLRKKKNFKRNKGSKTFILKWGISPTFFVKHYLKGGKFKNNKILSSVYNGPLNEPKKNLSYFINIFICKLKSIYFNKFKF